jgi:hypothetical protein
VVRGMLDMTDDHLRLDTADIQTFMNDWCEPALPRIIVCTAGFPYSRPESEDSLAPDPRVLRRAPGVVMVLDTVPGR